MSTEAIDRTEKRLGIRRPGFCYWHATGRNVGKRPIAPLCGARCTGKRNPSIRGKPCERHALKSKKRCHLHGGRNGGKRVPKYSPEVREARKRAQVQESDRLYALWLAKQAKPRPVLWEPAPQRSLEDVFREGRQRKRDRAWSPY
jgi:hypothetical protein